MSIHNFANRQLRRKEECFFFDDAETSNALFMISFCALCCRNGINAANLKRWRDAVIRLVHMDLFAARMTSTTHGLESLAVSTKSLPHLLLLLFFSTKMRVPLLLLWMQLSPDSQFGSQHLLSLCARTSDRFDTTIGCFHIPLFLENDLNHGP